MAFHIHNTLSGQKEAFQPIEAEAKKVRLYVCGPTVYDDAHLGHARCYITWDVLYRFLQYLGYKVRYARNITDVDDKILNRAQELNEPFKDLAIRFTQRFHEDMKALNTLPPTDEPRATDYIDEMIRGIETLIEKGSAYTTEDGSVYYRTASKADYGKLWKQPLDELKQEARVESEAGKESPLDFALWKSTPEDDINSWKTPWGQGRPGWHMECSAMNHQIFGDQIDIHTGGADLIFPHHENEIAQSEAWTDKTPFVKYWMHNGFVNVSGEKMSKSLGNFSTIKRVLERYDANTLRYFLLVNHYRMPVDLNDEALAGAKNRMIKIHRAFKLACQTLGLHPEVLREYPILEQTDAPQNPYLAEFEKHMSDDLGTPKALAVMDESIKSLNQAMAQNADDLPVIRKVFAQALSIFSHLGFNPQLVFQDAVFQDAKNTTSGNLPAKTIEALRIIYNELTGQWLEADKDPNSILEEITTLRIRAKEIKNWGQADAIRKHMTDIGIQLIDHKDGTTTWEPSSD